MGKPKSSEVIEKKKITEPSSSSIKIDKNAKKIGEISRMDALRAVELPKSSKGLTAEKLTEDQKHVFKKQCQKLYGPKSGDRRKLPATSIEVATSQLADKIKAQLAEKRKQKKLNKTTE